MAPRFTKGGKIEQLDGFRKIEVWQIDNTNDAEDMYVNTWWDNEKTSKLGPKVMRLKKHIKILENLQQKIHQ